MKKITFLSLALLTLFCSAKTPIVDLLDNEEMLKSADVVAVVQIERGTYSKKEQKFDVKADVVINLKGDNYQALEFTDSFLWQHPEKLGGYYLVYLQKTNSGFITLNTGMSVIELSPSEKQFGDELKRVAAERGIPESALIEYGSKIWFVSACLTGGKEFCLQAVATARHAFNK